MSAGRSSSTVTPTSGGRLPRASGFPWTPICGRRWPGGPRPRRGPTRRPQLRVLARLKPGVTVAQAQADMDAIAARLHQAHPKDYPAETTGARRWCRPRSDGRGRAAQSVDADRRGGLVLSHACANVATCSRARRGPPAGAGGAGGVGAPRWRLVRLLVSESLILSLAGGALGLLARLWGIDLLSSSVPDRPPRAARCGWTRRVERSPSWYPR